MAHGHADYGLGAARETIHPVDDLGELAARLGSNDTFDRRGNIIWMDDFATPLRWGTSALGAGSSVSRSNSYSHSSPFSIKLSTTGGSSSVAQIQKYIAKPVSSRIGIEATFSISTTVAQYLLLHYESLRIPDITAQLIYSRSEGKLYYLNSSSVVTLLKSGVDSLDRGGLFHTMKVVFDLETQEYVRAIFDNYEISMAGKGLYVYTPPGDGKSEFIRVSHEAQAAGAQAVYVSCFILTQNEP